jgi:hypothetical protein
LYGNAHDRHLVDFCCFTLKKLIILQVTILNQFHIFVIRAILGTVFAVILTRFFYAQIDVFHVTGLAVFLVGIAYLLDYIRSRKS